MTDADEHGRAEEQDYPEELGFGFGEILALLSVHGGEAAAGTADLLGLEDYTGLPEVLASGASSLVARGYAHVGASAELTVDGPIAGIAAALGGAERRMDLRLEARGFSDRILLLEAPGIAILLRPRAYSTWWALPQRTDVGPAEATLLLVQGHLAEHPDGRVLVARHEVGQGYALSVRSADDGGWLLGVRVPGAEDSPESPGDAETLRTALRAVRND
jgi:hypothetical protein